MGGGEGQFVRQGCGVERDLLFFLRGIIINACYTAPHHSAAAQYYKYGSFRVSDIKYTVHFSRLPSSEASFHPFVRPPT